MKFVSLTAKNFLAFKEIFYEFENKPILIQGENKDDDGQESNGACKSGLFNVIEFTLFGEVSRDQNLAELIRFNQSELETSLLLNCPIRKEDLLIKRKVAKRGGSAQLSVNGVVKWDFEDKMVSEINSFIIDWIGLTKKDFQSFYLINGENVKPLFKLSNSDLVALISRFSNVDLMNGIDDEIKKDIDAIEKEINLLEKEFNEVSGKIKGFQEQIDDFNSIDFEESKKQKIAEYESDIEREEHSISEQKQKKANLKKDVVRIKESLLTVSGNVKKLEDDFLIQEKDSLEDESTSIDKEISSIQSKTEKQEAEKDKIKKQLDDAEDLLSEIDKNIKGAVTCPNCSHKFSISHPDIDIQEETETKVKIEAVIEKITNSLNKVNKTLSNYLTEDKELRAKKRDAQFKENERQRKIREIESKINNLNHQIMNSKFDIKRKEMEITVCDSAIDKHNSVIADIKELIESTKSSKKNESFVDDLHGKIKHNEALIDGISDKIDIKGQVLYETKQWLYNFKKFNGYLANKSLKVIQGYTNKHLIEMGSDIQVRIDGFKENSKGDIVEKITPYLIRSGEERKLGSFSKGERGRINIATTMAIKSIMDKSNEWGGFSQLFMDEAAEGLGATGLSLVFKSVEKTGLPLMMTTHVTDKNVSNSVLLVRKEKGISKIIKN